MSVDSTTLFQALSNSPIEKLELGKAQNIILNTIEKSSYTSYFWSIFGVFYKFDVAQIFTVSFFYDFSTNTIKSSINKELISSDNNIDNREVDAELQKPLRDYEFKVVDWIKDNHGRFLYAKQSLGKVQLHCNPSANPILKEVIKTALTIINKNR